MTYCASVYSIFKWSLCWTRPQPWPQMLIVRHRFWLGRLFLPRAPLWSQLRRNPNSHLLGLHLGTRTHHPVEARTRFDHKNSGNRHQLGLIVNQTFKTTFQARLPGQEWPCHYYLLIKLNTNKVTPVAQMSISDGVAYFSLRSTQPQNTPYFDGL